MFPPPTPVVRNILILNAIIFAVIVLPGALGIPLNIEDKLALFYPSSEDFRPYQLVSNFFMHADFMHLFFNMLMLYFFGPELEKHLGPVRFLALYLVAALGAVALHLGSIWWDLSHALEWQAAFAADPSLSNFDPFFERMNLDGLVMNTGETVSSIVAQIQNDLVLGDDQTAAINEGKMLMSEFVYYHQETPVIGASGAVSGILAAFGVMYTWKELRLLFLPFSIPAIFLVGFILGGDVVMAYIDHGTDNVAHFAHIGGAIVGGLLAYFWKKTVLPPWLRRGDK